MTTALKQGEILERLVRKDRIGISEFSRRLKVSRRTIYNWFQQDRIDSEIIWRIGDLLGRDLSSSFPEHYSKYNSGDILGVTNLDKKDDLGRDTVFFWMNKYIQLLEKYNTLLAREALSDADPPSKEFPISVKRAEALWY
ncbi:helix-turn-helix domain-containing protein [Pedobacter sp. HDW13]|uniref:helix-turn-helix domain-containing protein n=1 Tax=Pedobacter sp. HDW13 TaxID=2714940 RepID=UPI00197E491A|nr:helix-turn-helix domain-containing protein [Pedobacter sp. HDW13]